MDEGTTIGVRVFMDEREAAFNHNIGLAKLFRDLKDEISQIMNGLARKSLYADSLADIGTQLEFLFRPEVIERLNPTDNCAVLIVQRRHRNLHRDPLLIFPGREDNNGGHIRSRLHTTRCLNSYSLIL